MTAALEQLLRLLAQDRMDAINTLWDSLDAGHEDFILTDEEQAELDRKLDDAERNPGFGCSWEELKSRLVSMD